MRIEVCQLALKITGGLLREANSCAGNGDVVQTVRLTANAEEELYKSAAGRDCYSLPGLKRRSIDTDKVRGTIGRIRERAMET